MIKSATLSVPTPHQRRGVTRLRSVPPLRYTHRSVLHRRSIAEGISTRVCPKQPICSCASDTFLLLFKLKMHYFAKKFAYIKKLLYLCTRI